MNTHRLLARFAGIGFAAMTISPSFAAMTTFRDVPQDAWFAAYVQQAADMGIVSGYGDSAGNPTGYFGPADSVSVTQSLKMEVGTVGIDVSKYRIGALTIENTTSHPLPFTQNWWYKYFLIAKAQSTNLSGCAFLANGGPDRPIRRWEMARLISDVYKLVPPNEQYDRDPYANGVVTNVYDSTLPNPYSDVDVTVRLSDSTIPSPLNPSEQDAFDFANDSASRSAILQLTADGVLSGDVSANGVRRFRPLDTLNRAEAVKILLKAQATYPASQATTPPSFELENKPPLPCTA